MLATSRPPLPPPPQLSSTPPAPPHSKSCPMVSPSSDDLPPALPPPSSFSRGAGGLDLDPDRVNSPGMFGVADGPGAPSVGSQLPSPAAPAVPPHLPPPDRLPPNFKPQVVGPLPLLEQGWEEVRRKKKEKLPAPPRKETGLSLAFNRRTFDLCFRCLEPDHFVTDYRGPVRCLSCRGSGHRERDCTARHSAGKGSHLRSSSLAADSGRSKDMPACRAPGPLLSVACSPSCSASWLVGIRCFPP